MRNARNSLSTGSTEEPVFESVLHFQEYHHKFNERSVPSSCFSFPECWEMGCSLQKARVPRDTEHQPVSGVFTRLSIPTDPCYPLKAMPGEMFAPAPQITENEGQTYFKCSSQLPPFQFCRWEVGCCWSSVLILIYSVPLKLAKVYRKHFIRQKTASECFGWILKLFMGNMCVQATCKQYFICHFKEYRLAIMPSALMQPHLCCLEKRKAAQARSRFVFSPFWMCWCSGTLFLLSSPPLTELRQVGLQASPSGHDIITAFWHICMCAAGVG